MTAEKQAVLLYHRRDDGAILSVWNRKYLCWGLPGGKVEELENLTQALEREVQEETGLFMNPWRPTRRWELLDVSPTYSGSGRVCYTFQPLFPLEGYLTTREVGGGIGWMTRKFLRCEPSTGAWFRAFFDRLDAKGVK